MLPHFLGVRQNLSAIVRFWRLNVVANVCCEYVFKNILFFITTCILQSYNPIWWLQSSLITLRRVWTLLTMKWSRLRELSNGWASVVVFVFCPGRGKLLIIGVVTSARMLWSRSVSSSSRSSRLSSILSRANQPVDEDGMWKLEDGTADSSKNHKNFNSGVPKGGRFVSK